jgi:hypothetical protein
MFYKGVGVAIEEKRAWIMGVVSVIAYAVYIAIILGRADDGGLARTPYVTVMLWSIGGAIVLSILLNIVAAIAGPRDATLKDQRDREIGRFGDHVGQSFVVIGGVAALLLAMAEADYFWIANVVYLAFVLSAVLGSVARIFAYRGGFQEW